MKRTVITLLALLVLPFGTALGQPNAWINEIHYDNDGGDTGEFVEVVVENASNYTLSNIQVLHYNGTDGNSDAASPVTLDTFTSDVTVGDFTIYYYDYTANGESLQNSKEALALCFDNNSDGTYETLLSSGGVDQFLSYEGTVTGTTSDGCAGGLTSTDIGVDEQPAPPEGQSLQLTGTGSNYTDFDWNDPAAESPGSVNSGQTLSSSTGPVTIVGGGSYSTIQAAIDAASANDVIEVSGGPFEETVTIDVEGLTLQGVPDGASGSAAASKAAPAGAPTINGQVILSASNTVFEDFIVSPLDATTNPTGEAIRIDSGADGVIVRNNTVQNFTENGLSEDIEGIVAFGGSSDPVEDPQITNNLVQDITRTSSAGGAVGISVQGNVQNATVSGNTVRRISKQTAPYGFGIVVRGSGNTGGPPIDASITNNTISSIISDGTFAGVGFGVEKDPTPGEGDPTVALVTGNTLSNTELQAEDKTFALDLNAFIANNTLDRAAVIRDGGGGVKDETYAQRVYSSIGAPVSRAVAGETVEAFAGTYEEQVAITTDDLTLVGASSGSTTIQSPSGALQSIGSLQPVLGVNEAIGVTIRNLTVDGNGQGDAQGGGFAGIGFSDAGGTVEDVTVTGVRNDPLSGAQRGTGIRAENEDGAARSVTITNTTVQDFQKNGITLQGAGLTVDVSGNTVTGAGPITEIAQNGIEVDDGAEGTIASNQITDISYTGTPGNDFVASAIIPNGALSVTGNTVQNSQVGIFALSAADATFANNVINAPASPTTRTGDVYGLIVYGIAPASSSAAPASSKRTTVASSLPVRPSTDLDLDAAWNSRSKAAKASAPAFTINGNTIEGQEEGTGLVIASIYDGSTFTGGQNLIASFNRGVTVTDLAGQGFPGLPGSVALNQNCIIENQEWGVINVLSSPEIDATNNWWGSAAGPGTDGANGVDGPVDADPFAIDPVSGVEGCGGATDECKPSKFEETVVSSEPPGEVKITINDTEGIDQVRFYEVDNFTIASDAGDFADSDGDGIWTPSGLSTSTTFTLTQADPDVPNATYFAQITNGCGTLTDIDPPHGFDVVPAAFALGGNYPNPFRTQTTLQFDLPEPVDVTLSIYDVMGRKVATLVDQPLQAGAHEVRWDGRSASGSTVASGVYLLRLQAGEQVATRRLTVVK